MAPVADLKGLGGGGIYGSSLPAAQTSFGIIAVVGPTDSGKTTRLKELAKYFGLAEVKAQEEWNPKQAIVSHPAFWKGSHAEDPATEQHKPKGLDLLQCVGLNRVPAWVRPFQVLSNGEASRAQCAVQLAKSQGRGIVIDDFAALVDDQNAASMASSLRKLVEKKQLCRVLIASTKTSVLSHLAPEYVLFTKHANGMAKLIPNPWGSAVKIPRPKLKGVQELKFVSAGPVRGWTSKRAADVGQIRHRSSQEQGAGRHRKAVLVPFGSVSYNRSCEVVCDDACVEVARAFDFSLEWQQRLYAVDPACLPDSFSLAAMVGPSGTGKTSALQKLSGGLMPASYSWNPDLPIVKQIPGAPREIEEILSALALPQHHWLMPFHQLSTSQQAAAEAAMLLTKRGSLPICLDEFTSTADRLTAERICKGLSTLIRRRHASGQALQPVIVATVHEDILQWLLPDWVFFAEAGQLVIFDGPVPTAEDVARTGNPGMHLRDSKRQPSCPDGKNLTEVKRLLEPKVLQMSLHHLKDNKTSQRVFKAIFEEHHYKKGELPNPFHGVLARHNGAPAAFHAVASQFGRGHGTCSLRESRLVVLPQFQGFGLGPLLSEAIGDRLLASKMRLFSKTHHPRLGNYRQHSSRWKATDDNLRLSRGGKMSAPGVGGGKSAKKRKVAGADDEGISNVVEPESLKGGGMGDENMEYSVKTQSRETDALEPAAGRTSIEHKMSLRRPYCHQYIGDTADGNDHLVAGLRNQNSKKAKASAKKFSKKMLKIQSEQRAEPARSSKGQNSGEEKSEGKKREGRGKSAPPHTESKTCPNCPYGFQRHRNQTQQLSHCHRCLRERKVKQEKTMAKVQRQLNR